MPHPLKRFFASLAIGLLLGALAARSAHAYRLPPEKVLQYWTQTFGKYGGLEVRVQHSLFGAPGTSADVAPAVLTLSRSGMFRFEREGGALTVIGTPSDVLAVRDRAILPPETVRRYEFTRLFVAPAQIDADEKAQMLAQGVLLDSPGALWLLGRLSDLGIEWKKTRLAPYAGGKTAYVIGTDYRDPRPAEGPGALSEPAALFDNRNFFPLELRRYADAGGVWTLYRAVFSGYRNEVLQNFPRKISLYVGELLAEELVLSSARQSPKPRPGEFDLEALRKSAAPSPPAREASRP